MGAVTGWRTMSDAVVSVSPSFPEHPVTGHLSSLQDAFSNGTVTSGGQTTTISGFQGGPVYDIPMVDDTVSYYLDCVNQFGPPDQLLLLTQANACPASAPQRWDSSFSVTFDSSF